MTTNDEQAKSEQREPMYSDYLLEKAQEYAMRDGLPSHAGYETMFAAKQVRNFYEAKITSGELMARNANMVHILRKYVAECEANGCGEAAEGSPLAMARQQLAKIIE